MLETIVIDVDDECVIPPKKPFFFLLILTTNFKRSRLWKCHEVGMVSTMKCGVSTKIERKGKILVAKWDTIENCASKWKGFDGKWIMDPKCMHVKNEISYAQCFTTTILQ